MSKLIGFVHVFIFMHVHCTAPMYMVLLIFYYWDFLKTLDLNAFLRMLFDANVTHLTLTCL